MPSVNAHSSDPLEIERWGLDANKPISAGKRPCAFWQVGDTLYEFYRFPHLFRLKHISDWVTEHDTFGIPEKLKDCHPVWVDLMNIYRPFYSHVVAQKQKESQAKNG